MLTTKRLSIIDDLVKNLSNEDDKWMSLAIAIDLADEVLKVILPDNNDWENQLNRDSRNTGKLPEPLPLDTFKNQKQVSWFNIHPESTSARSAFKLFYSDDCALESNFFWFSESATKQKIAAATEYSQNWEDSDLTRKPEYKVGIDFFLTPDTNSLMVVISNHQKLRVLELHGCLSNTQKIIFKDKLNGAASYTGIENGKQLEFEPQRTIHTTLWNALQLREVNKQFYTGIAKSFELLVDVLVIENGKKQEDSEQFATRLLGRLLFVWFLRKMNVINEKYEYFNIDGLDSTSYYNNKLKILFFRTLNVSVENRMHMDMSTPYLNGGLFDPKDNDYINDSIIFPNKFFENIYSHFENFNFTTDESNSDFELIAVDPEMLGQVFESLLDSHGTEIGVSNRKDTGSFYTPREIVDYMCKETLRNYLYGKINKKQFNVGIDNLLDLSDSQFLIKKSTGQADLWGINSNVVVRQINNALDSFKVIDPSCGSGAFPMGMLQLLLKTYERINPKIDRYEYKLKIIENNLFGVDIQPMAIEITRLRAWLSVIIDEHDKDNIAPLPNLDFKFICANTLINLYNPESTNEFMDNNLDEKLNKLRKKYFKEKKPDKKKKIQNQYYNMIETMGLFDDERSKQLKSFEPFTNKTFACFFDKSYMFGIQDGFDAVIGNPPYLGESGNKEKFDLIKNTSLGKRFYQGKMDLFYFFFHFGIDNLKENGILAYITTNYYPTADGAFNLRTDILERTNVLLLINFNEYKIFDSAKGQHNLITILKKTTNNDILTKQTYVTNKANNSENDLDKVLMGTYEYAIYTEVGVEDLYDTSENYIRFSSNNSPLEKILESMKINSKILDSYCTVNQGVVPGALTLTDSHMKKFKNIDAQKGDPIFIFPKGEIEKLGGEINAEYIAPYFKNSDIYRYVTKNETDKELLYSDGNIVIPDGILDYLAKFKDILVNRREFVDGKLPWYRLHWPRTLDVFTGPKIVVPYRCKENKFAYNDFPFFGSTDIYFINKRAGKNFDLKALLAILNSELIFVWLYYRGKRKGEVLELFTTPLKNIPIVLPSLEKQEELSKLVNEIMMIKKNEEITLDIIEKENRINSIVYESYGLSKDEIKIIKKIISTIRK